MENVGEWWRFEDRKFDTLFIAFSAVNTPVGKFTAERLFRHHPVSLLMFNDPGNDWYQRKIREIEGIIGRIFVSRPWKRVVFYGYSMGAYAALRFGLNIDAATIYALSPQFIVGLPGSVSTQFTREKSPEDHDIRKMLTRERSANAYILLPCYSLRDGAAVRFAQMLDNKSVSTTFMKTNHFIQPTLYNRDELMEILASAAAGQPPTIHGELLADERDIALSSDAFDAFYKWRRGQTFDIHSIDDYSIPNQEWIDFKAKATAPA